MITVGLLFCILIGKICDPTWKWAQPRSERFVISASAACVSCVCVKNRWLQDRMGRLSRAWVAHQGDWNLFCRQNEVKRGLKAKWQDQIDFLFRKIILAAVRRAIVKWRERWQERRKEGGDDRQQEPQWRRDNAPLTPTLEGLVSSQIQAGQEVEAQRCSKFGNFGDCFLEKNKE